VNLRIVAAFARTMEAGGLALSDAHLVVLTFPATARSCPIRA